ncbi:MAG: pyruvate kinase [Candidatus Marinimicrobia bacterium]|jgi:pyruvate kinase|nr:pyruvate kinase [Candidatus Neomarinimicrobiota bacterium]MBT3840054.1 pyruvate kinase [Candidatus Neomarinimicrobiota bacterium]MBT4000086.1 pyruvate kinase [Candidatus Neomarinimicrobiota bacterium]MBT4282115.1 pyruvate kinase [Candidatus Neomarinimicrobiota bacterium]MBT4578854.1 pyruvate kinase [Candidatus Neomarinimicrobiota bacterium]
MKLTSTKIIATVGPSCSTPKMIQSLVDKGVNCFRVNLSHGSQKEKESYFKLICSLQLPSGGRPAILGDLSGPKIRVNGLESSLELNDGDIVTISNKLKGRTVIPVSSGVKFQKVEEGAKILINDGRVELEVIEHISNSTLKCKTTIPGIVENRKGVNFPGIQLDVPTLTEQDKEDLELALKNGADWLALSFVRSASDYGLVRSRVKKLGYTVPIMAKIEKWEAVQNLDEIIDIFDGVMVARGDLGVELPIERVPKIQQDVIDKARHVGKPVVIATQILDSMTERPVPTRAEVSDIANAILEGADALMVTGETAAGDYPEKVINVLTRVIKETESNIQYHDHPISRGNKKLITARAISHAACSVAYEQDIKILVTMTHTGSTARMVSKYRPSARIVAMTPIESICRQLSIVWGVTSFLVKEYNSTDKIQDVVNEVLIDENILTSGEKFVVTGGVPVGVPGTTNYLSVIKKI